MPSYLERARVDFDQHVVHHADGVVLRPVCAQSRSVRHRARLDARDLHHLIRGHHGYVGRDHLAVQVEIHDPYEIAIGRYLHGRRKVAKHHLSNRCVVLRRVFLQPTKRSPVRGRGIPVFPIW